MARSPFIRLVVASVLVVLVVVAAFAYGNSQRAKQQQANQAVEREARVKQDSEAKRDAKKQQAAKDADAKAKQDNSQASSSVPSSSSATLPDLGQMPATGSRATFSFMLAALTLPSLLILLIKKATSAQQP
jgi:Flp pilus assembly protein TadB